MKRGNKGKLIFGSREDESLLGSDRNDLMFGRGGDDVLDGGAGNDILFGGKGNDWLFGGAGNDLLFGGKGHDWLFGGAGNDLLSGGKGNDRLDGGDGNDLLLGGRGDDVLDGGEGNDLLLGGKGNDTLLGGAGNDKLIGGKGDDTLDGGAGSDRALGGGGDDFFNYTLAENVESKDYYGGGRGFDTLQLTLTSAELLMVQEEIDAFQAFLASGGGKFTFGFGLTASGFEALLLNVVDGGNAAPSAANDLFAAVEDAVLVIASPGVLDNDTDPEGVALSATLVTGPANGSVTLSTDGSFTYTPNADFFGEDSFTYTASDGTLDSNIATVTLMVAGVNDDPVAVADAFELDEDTMVSGNVLANDSDVDGDTLSAALEQGPENGQLAFNSDGSFTYTPDLNFNGSDSFSYEVSDGQGGTATAAVSLTINPVNDAPVAQDDELPNTLTGAIRVAVVGASDSGFLGAADQLSDSTAFNIAADAILVTAFATNEEWDAALSGYDVVVVGDSGDGNDYNGAGGLFSALRDFVDAGNGIISTGLFATLLDSVAPALAVDMDYVSPAAPFADLVVADSGNITVLDSTHPIAGGITEYAVQGLAHELAGAVDTTATVLAEGTSTLSPTTGTVFAAIAYDEVGPELGRTAFLGTPHMGGNFFRGSETRDGAVDQIFEQAVAWSAGDLDPVAATDEDTALIIDDAFLFANDSDVDGDTLAIEEGNIDAFSVFGAAISIEPNGDIRYDPIVSEDLQDLAAGQIVEDSFQYRASDGNGGLSDWATVSLSVLGRAEADSLIG